MPESQVDIAGSPVRTGALFLGSCGFVGLCAWLLYARPDMGSRSLVSGSFAEFALAAGGLFFAVCAVFIAPRLLRRGPVVSVGQRGIFDRRLSTDWLPWSAIRAVGTFEMRNQRWFVLQFDPEREPALPLRKTAKRLARLNRGFGPDGYPVSGADLRGGFPALAAAIQRFHHGAQSGRH